MKAMGLSPYMGHVGVDLISMGIGMHLHTSSSRQVATRGHLAILKKHAIYDPCMYFYSCPTLF
jgi:hypothetical protein